MSINNSVVKRSLAPTAPTARGALLAAVVLALACPSAGAQVPQLPELPQLPHIDQAPVTDVVKGVVNEPLPAPVEDVVENSPVAPIRDEVRRIVGDVSANPSAPESSGVTPESSGVTTGPASQTRSPSSPSTGRSVQRRGASGSNPQRGSRDATVGTRREGGVSADRPARAAERRPQKTATDDAQNPVSRTIEKIVEVIPTAVWIALGVLLALAASLGVRTLVERRRTRELERDRDRLMRDVGALERALLPAVPELLGALATSVAHRASEGPAAGGDFYDAFELADGRVAVLVGDVSGHGPDALDRTNVLRAALHDRLSAGLSPRAALESVGRGVSLESSGKFATAVVAVHDPADGTLTYATAGHPPPIITGRGAHEPITTGSSPPIGVGLRTGLRETRAPLPAETVVCLFTDGLLEARVDDDLMGREELTRFVAELGSEQYADSLLAQVIAVADEVPDDMAVFVLRPVAGAETVGPRIETLVLDAEDLAVGVAERFLEACEVPAYQVETALEALSAAAAASGGAVLEVTIDYTDPQVRVSRAEPQRSLASFK